MAERGPITQSELFQVLQSTVDPLYLQPFLEQGYGSGLEAFEALCAVLARVSAAADRTCQALFIRPWSGQTAPPAMGPGVASVELVLARGEPLAAQPLTIRAGQVLFEEVATDWGPTGGVPTVTGRRFTLREDFTFLPGQVGPVTLAALATNIGYGPANVLPGTITGVAQPGSSFANTGASVVQGASTARLILGPDPDVITPDQVGQYVRFIAGANAGRVCRISGYEPADPSVPTGGAAVLASVLVARNVGGVAPGAFEIGETAVQLDSSTLPPTQIGTATVLAVTQPADGSPWYLVLERSAGDFAPTGGTIGPILGLSSGASFEAQDFSWPTNLANEAGAASWEVLDFLVTWGLSVTNPEAPTPGAQAMLDAIGEERRIGRAPGEGDESYRGRVSQVADVVSPAAIRRTGNRVWGPLGGSVCLREVGLPQLPGLYFEGDPGSTTTLAGYSYDEDGLKLLGVKTGRFFDGERVYQDNGGVLSLGRVTSTTPPGPAGGPVPGVPGNELELAGLRGSAFQLGVPIVGERSGATMVPTTILYGLRPQDRFKVQLDYTEFRAFFLLGVPPSSMGEFGIAYDVGANNAFDAFLYLAFYDGFPLTAAVLYRTTWDAIDRARAGGVGFDLYLEDKNCT